MGFSTLSENSSKTNTMTGETLRKLLKIEFEKNQFKIDERMSRSLSNFWLSLVLKHGLFRELVFNFDEFWWKGY
jgi:hypothetical protein